MNYTDALDKVVKWWAEGQRFRGPLFHRYEGDLNGGLIVCEDGIENPDANPIMVWIGPVISAGNRMIRLLVFCAQDEKYRAGFSWLSTESYPASKGRRVVFLGYVPT